MDIFDSTVLLLLLYAYSSLDPRNVRPLAVRRLFDGPSPYDNTQEPVTLIVY